MVIESIHINRFGMLRNLDLEFAKGFHIVEGPNESGKSTLAAFIRFMLYGFSTRGGEHGLSERRKRVSWEGGRADGYMIVSTEKGRFRIERITEEVEGGRYRENSAIIDLATGSPCGARSLAGEFLLGVPEEVFLESAYFGQLSDTAVDSRKMQEAMENILFSGNEKINTLRAVSKLDEARRSILHKSGRGGTLFELRRQRDALQAQIDDAVRIKEGLLEKEALLKDTVSRKDEARREEAKFTKLESDYRNTLIIRTYDYLHELEEQLSAVQKGIADYEQKNSHKGFFPSYEYLTHVAVARRGAKDAQDAYAEALARVQDLEEEAQRDDEAEKLVAKVDAAGGESAVLEDYRFRRKRGIGLCFGGGFAALGASIVLSLGVIMGIGSQLVSMAALLLVGALLSAAGALLLVNGVRFLLNARGIALEYSTSGDDGMRIAMELVSEARRRGHYRKERMTQAESNRVAGLLRAQKARDELAALALQWGRELSLESSVAEQDSLLDQLVQDASSVITERSRLRAQSVSLEASIRETCRQIGDRDEVSVRATVAPADREKLTKLNHKDLLSGIEQCQRQVRFYEEKQRELEHLLVENRARAAEPAALAEQLEILNNRIEELEKKHDAYVLAMESINGAGEGLRKEIAPRLISYAEGLFSEATDGKYPSIGVTDELTLMVNDGEKTREVEFLSAGTRDAAYLSLRMALVDLLFKEAPPLCLDETLSKQDDTRAAGLLRMLRNLCNEGRQCFLFTCHERDANLARGILSYQHIRLSHGEAEVKEIV